MTSRNRSATRWRCVVAFAAALSIGTAAHAITFIELIDTGGDFSTLGLPSINESGVVAFGGTDTTGPGTGEGIFTITAGTAFSPTTVADEAVFDDFFNDELGSSVEYVPAIGEDGSVAFGANVTLGSPGTVIAVSDGSAVTGGTTIGSYTVIEGAPRDDGIPTDPFSPFVSIASSGDVAYGPHDGTIDTTGTVVVGDGGGPPADAATSGDFTGSPSLGIAKINDGGDLAFAVLSDTDAGLYVNGIDPGTDRIVAPADIDAAAVFGSYISYNDAGQIAFVIEGTASDDGIWRVDDDGTGLVQLTSDLPKIDLAFALDNAGNLVYVDAATGDLIRVPDGGTARTLVDGSGLFDGMTLGPGGIVLFTDSYSATGIVVAVDFGATQSLYLLVPEPTSLATVGGLLMLTAARRRRFDR